MMASKGSRREESILQALFMNFSYFGFDKAKEQAVSIMFFIMNLLIQYHTLIRLLKFEETAGRLEILC